MKSLTAFFILSIALFGCKTASEVSNNKAIQPDSSDQNANISLQDDAGSSDGVTPGLVMSDDFVKNGFVVYREEITNLWMKPVSLRFSLNSSQYQLFTRINEHSQISALMSSGRTGDYSKLSTLSLLITEAKATRSNGAVEKIDLSDSSQAFNLDPSEKIEVSWIARAVANSVVCPFYSKIHTDQGFGSISDLTWALAGASISGNFVRTIQARAVASDGSNVTIPVVTKVGQSLKINAGDGNPHSDDRDFGCNGFMQSMN